MASGGNERGLYDGRITPLPNNSPDSGRFLRAAGHANQFSDRDGRTPTHPNRHALTFPDALRSRGGDEATPL